MKTIKKEKIVSVLTAVGATFYASPIFASVESTLLAIQGKFLNVLLPILAVIGLLFAAFSFVMGHENARGRLMLAIFGAVIGFLAPSLVDFIRGLVS